MNGKEAYDKIFDKLTYDQQQELGDQVLRTVYQDLNRLEKLEKAIEILKEHFFIDLIERVNDGKLAFVPKTPIENQPTFSRLTQEQYKLLKELLGNKWYNKPLPAFAPKEKYNYSFANDCFQKAEKYDCERLEKENQELKNTILSLEVDTCIPELREENTKLKNSIKIIINKGVNELFLKNTKIFTEYNKIVKHLEYFNELTQEEYELLKEVL